MHPKETKDKVERLYFVQKLKIVNIVKELNVSRGYVKNIIDAKKKGKSIDRKNYDSSSRFILKPQDMIKIKNYLKDESKCKNSLKQIANDLGLPSKCKATLSRALKRLGAKFENGIIDTSDANNNIELNQLKLEIAKLKQDNRNLKIIIDKNKLNKSNNLIFLGKKITELEKERDKLNNPINLIYFNTKINELEKERTKLNNLDYFIKILESVKEKISI